MRTLLRILSFASALSCAALNTERMTPACRDSYNACLDGCPPAPSVNPDSPGPHDGPYYGTALCTDACNRSAQACR